MRKLIGLVFVGISLYYQINLYLKFVNEINEGLFLLGGYLGSIIHFFIMNFVIEIPLNVLLIIGIVLIFKRKKPKKKDYYEY